jgi:hypothetical protein
MTYMKMAQISPTGQTTYSESVVRLADLATIPFDEKNRDYAEYLEWIEAGNEPVDFNIELLQPLDP